MVKIVSTDAKVYYLLVLLKCHAHAYTCTAELKLIGRAQERFVCCYDKLSAGSWLVGTVAMVSGCSTAR